MRSNSNSTSLEELRWRAWFSRPTKACEHINWGKRICLTNKSSFVKKCPESVAYGFI